MTVFAFLPLLLLLVRFPKIILVEHVHLLQLLLVINGAAQNRGAQENVALAVVALGILEDHVLSLLRVGALIVITVLIRLLLSHVLALRALRA